METKIFSADELRGFEPDRLRELEGEIRRELNDIRMDVYQPAGANAGKKNIFRRNLARLLTVQSEKSRKSK